MVHYREWTIYLLYYNEIHYFPSLHLKMALQLIWKFCNGCNSGLQPSELQLVADFYIKILCSRFCNWLQPGLQPPELQLPSCRAILNLAWKKYIFHGTIYKILHFDSFQKSCDHEIFIAFLIGNFSRNWWYGAESCGTKWLAL